MQISAQNSAVGTTRRNAWYFGLLAVACLLFAGQGTAVKFMARQLHPLQITFIPFCGATVLMLPLLWRARISNSKARRLIAGDWGRFILVGLVGQFAAQLCFVSGVTRSLASNASILSLLLPVISTALASVMLRERITRLRALALGIGLVGVLFLSAGKVSKGSLLGMGYLVGNLLCLAGTTGSAFYNVYCKGLFERFQQIEVLVFSYIVVSIASVPLLLCVDPLEHSLLMTLDWKTWVALGYEAFAVHSVAMLLFFSALDYLDVSVASFALYMLPVFGVVLAAIFLGERLGPLALCGGAIVLLSTILIVRYDQGRTVQ